MNYNDNTISAVDEAFNVYDPADFQGKFLAIDFDGTIVAEEYPDIGRDLGAFPYLHRYQSAGAKIVLLTMRSGGKLQEAVDYCRTYGAFEFDYINCNPEHEMQWAHGKYNNQMSRKVFANMYIDDRSVGVPISGKNVIWTRVDEIIRERIGSV